MQHPHISLQLDPPLGIVTLSGPDPANRITPELCEELGAAIDRIADAEEIRVAVVTGEGEVFSAGTEVAVSDARAGSLPRVSEQVSRLSIPVIAAINGDAHGLGLELALACDLRVASNQATFAMDQVRYGMMPWDGGTQRLPRLVGTGRGAAMLLTGSRVGAREALEMGLVHAVFPHADLMNETLSLARKIATHAPIALRYAKETVQKGMDMTLEQGLRLEQDLTVILQSTSDRAEGIKSFLERRPPEFRGE